MALETLMLSVPFPSVGDQDGRKAICVLIRENHVARSGGWSKHDVIHPFRIFKPRSRNKTSPPSKSQRSKSQSILAETFFIRTRTFNIVDQPAMVRPACHALDIRSFIWPRPRALPDRDPNTVAYFLTLGFQPLPRSVCIYRGFQGYPRTA